MGDILMSTPAYKAVKERFPNTEVLTMKCSQEVAEFTGVKVHTSWKTIGKPDIAIHLHTSFKTNLKLWFKRIPLRIGYSYKWCGIPLNVRIPISCRTITSQYRVDEVCDLLEKAFGWEIKDRQMIG